MADITDHPKSRLLKRIEVQEKQIRDLSIDVMVLKDLLCRTVRMLARLENEGVLPVPDRRPKLIK